MLYRYNHAEFIITILVSAVSRRRAEAIAFVEDGHDKIRSDYLEKYVQRNINGHFAERAHHWYWLKAATKRIIGLLTKKAAQRDCRIV